MPDSIIGKISVGDGATFTPSVNSAGELSWTNNKNLPNPETVDLAQAVINSGAGIFLPLSGGTLTGVVNGVTPTAGDNSTKIATTEFVNAKAGNYLPLSGGTVTGDLTVTGALDGTASGNLPLSGGSITGDVDITGDLSVSGAIYSSDPASGENSGQVPTTAWVQKLLADALAKAKLDAHPVGSYYWSNDSTSPATLFGGTWEALPPGYTLIAQGSGSDSFGSYTYTAGQKYGERKHKLTTDELPHIHGTVSDIARQSVDQKLSTSGVFSAPAYVEGVTFGTNFTNNQGDGFVMDFGKDVPHENLSPCVAAYGWRRTA